MYGSTVAVNSVSFINGNPVIKNNGTKTKTFLLGFRAVFITRHTIVAGIVIRLDVSVSIRPYFVSG